MLCYVCCSFFGSFLVYIERVCVIVRISGATSSQKLLISKANITHHFLSHRFVSVSLACVCNDVRHIEQVLSKS